MNRQTRSTITKPAALTMTVIKRGNVRAPVCNEKVAIHLRRIAAYPTQLRCNPSFVAEKVCESITDGVHTAHLNDYTVRIASDMGQHDYEFLTLAARVVTHHIQSITSGCFSAFVEIAYKNRDLLGRERPRVNKWFCKFVRAHATQLNAIPQYVRDYDFTLFGMETLIDRYLLKASGAPQQLEQRPQDFVIERPQDMWMRITCALWMNRDSANDSRPLADIARSYTALSTGRIMLATPTLYNAGTQHEQLLSCYLMGGDDSITGIYKLASDMAQLSKHSGGIGFHWDLRSSGEEVGSSARSDGPVPFLRVVAATMSAVNQGGKRPGSAAHYLEPTHPDFMHWVRLRRPGEPGAIDTLFYAVWASDEFMRRVEADELWYWFDPHRNPQLSSLYGDAYTAELTRLIASREYKGEPVRARDVMRAIVHTQVETGMPYMAFKDAINRKSMQRNIGTIKSSNLCVSGRTPILTRAGWQRIDTLTDREVELWNGHEWSLSMVRQTSKSAQLIEIETDTGAVLRCTREHQFILKDSSRVDASRLEIGTVIAKPAELPIIEHEGCVLKYAYTAGMFCGDGTYEKPEGTVPVPCTNRATTGRYCRYHKALAKDDDETSDVCQGFTTPHRGPRIDLYGAKMKLLEHIEYRYTRSYMSKQDKMGVVLHSDILAKYEVPEQYDIASRLAWLAGLMDSDGTLASNAVQLTSVDMPFLRRVQLMCQTMGCNPSIKTGQKTGGMRALGDGHGGSKEYMCKPSWRMLFGKTDMRMLWALGLRTHRIAYDPEQAFNARAAGPRNPKISAIRDIADPEPTWCFGEPARNQGMFAGIVTGQCLEICLYSSAREYACCCLGSVCFPAHVRACDCEEWRASDPATRVPAGMRDGHQQGCTGTRRIDYASVAEAARELVRLLNRVVDVNYYPVPETLESNRRHRPLAIGVQGLADMFAMLRLPFTSDEARRINRDVHESLYYGAVDESARLAERDGPYETWRGDRINNPTDATQLSPWARGEFQWHLWGLTEHDLMGRWDWSALIARVRRTGMRNSTLTAIAPTASTSHIRGNNECVEPFTENLYVRKTLSGEHLIINTHLMRELTTLGLWSSSMGRDLVAARGSVQRLDVPQWIKDVYLTAWEMDSRKLVDMDAERGPFVDQTQSSNRFIAQPTLHGMIAMHMRAWRAGLKTGMYYLRTLSASKSTQFSVGMRAARPDMATPSTCITPADPRDMASPLELTCTPLDAKSRSTSAPGAGSEPAALRISGGLLASLPEEMTCELKRENGVACFSCQ